MAQKSRIHGGCKLRNNAKSNKQERMHWSVCQRERERERDAKR